MFLTKVFSVVSFSLLLTMFSCSYGSSVEHEDRIQAVETMVDNLRQRLEKAETELKEYRKEGKPDKPSPLVIPGYAFYVRKTSHAVAGNEVTPVYYEDIVLNHGGAWIQVNSQFICPVKGIYVFYMSSMSHDSGNRTETHIHRNGASVAMAWASPTAGVYQVASNMAVLSLEAGDLVNVVMLAYTRLWGNNRSTFSGFLLAQDEP